MAWRTNYFRLEEFTRSDTATRLGISNVPNTEQVLNLCVLAACVLEPVRKWYGKPFVITSGFRSPALNKAVGGVSTSYHLKGQAADIHITSQDEAEKIGKELIKQPLCDMVLIEHSKKTAWLHVQFRYDNPRHYFNKNYKA